MRFSDIIGQENLKNRFIESFKRGRVAHAQILCGENGYGILPFAIAFAQYILCEDRQDGDSCGVCPSCYKVSQLQHPDLHFSFPINKSRFCETFSKEGDVISDSLINKWRELIYTSSPNGYFSENDWYQTIELSKNTQGIIGRPEANELIRKHSFKSFLGGYKIFIIWLPEKMNESAANSLLKLFEEPSKDTLFLFCSENKDKIIKTILSRTQLTNIAPIDINSVNNYVYKEFGESEKNSVISRICNGNILKLNQLINQKEDNDVNFEMFTTLMRLCFFVNYIGLIDWAENYSTQTREQLKSFFDYSLKILRDSYLLTIGMESLSFSYGYEYEFIKKFYPYVHHKNIEQLIKEFERASFDTSRNGNQRIILTQFVLSISKLITLK